MKKTKSIFIKMRFSVWLYIFVSAKFDFYLIKFRADQITQLFVSLQWTIWTNILFVLLRQNLNPNKSHVSCSCFLNNWCQNTPQCDQHFYFLFWKYITFGKWTKNIIQIQCWKRWCDGLFLIIVIWIKPIKYIMFLT